MRATNNQVNEQHFLFGILEKIGERTVKSVFKVLFSIKSAFNTNKTWWEWRRARVLFACWKKIFWVKEQNTTTKRMSILGSTPPYKVWWLVLSYIPTRKILQHFTSIKKHRSADSVLWAAVKRLCWSIGSGNDNWARGETKDREETSWDWSDTENFCVLSAHSPHLPFLFRSPPELC